MGFPTSFLSSIMPLYVTELWRKSMNCMCCPSGDKKNIASARAPGSLITFWATLSFSSLRLLAFSPCTSASAPEGPSELPLRSKYRSAVLWLSMSLRYVTQGASRRLYVRLKCSSVGCCRIGPVHNGSMPLSPSRQTPRYNDFKVLFLLRPALKSPWRPSASQMLLLSTTSSMEVLSASSRPIALKPSAPTFARGRMSFFRELLPAKPFSKNSAPSSPILLSERFSSSKVGARSLSRSFSKIERTTWLPYFVPHWWIEVCGFSRRWKLSFVLARSTTSLAPRPVGTETGLATAAAMAMS
mmetsp:Transcript_77407/g.215152  ORF Transcript_77407/g.215152 Transcript_77407/m.215152 type:complete len:299 (-) Transcript_77407:74-970(-)